MATNNSGFINSNCLLVSEERWERERREKKKERELSGEELAKRIAEEKCLCCISAVTCLLIAEADRVLCHLIMF